MPTLKQILERSVNWPDKDTVEDYYVHGPMSVDDEATVEIGVKFAGQDGFTLFTIPLEPKFLIIEPRQPMWGKRSAIDHRKTGFD